MNTQTVRQFIIYTMVGGVGTAGHYLSLMMLVELLLVDTTLATSVGFIIGALINYFLNYFITFKSTKSHQRALLMFMLSAAIGGLVNSVIMYLGATVLHYHYMLVQLMATAFVLLWTFTINKIWVFAVSS